MRNEHPTDPIACLFHVGAKFHIQSALRPFLSFLCAFAPYEDVQARVSSTVVELRCSCAREGGGGAFCNRGFLFIPVILNEHS
jgi:hypothetical protein